MSNSDFRVVLVTAPDVDTARKIAQKALEARLIACANIVPGIESLYWWQGKIESSNELLLLMKTDAWSIAELEKNVLSNHPYDTPEFVVLDIAGGNHRYLDWIRSSLQQ